MRGLQQTLARGLALSYYRHATFLYHEAAEAKLVELQHGKPEVRSSNPVCFFFPQDWYIIKQCCLCLPPTTGPAQVLLALCALTT